MTVSQLCLTGGEDHYPKSTIAIGDFNEDGSAPCFSTVDRDVDRDGARA
jgi:hypothetical protein